MAAEEGRRGGDPRAAASLSGVTCLPSTFLEVGDLRGVRRAKRSLLTTILWSGLSGGLETVADACGRVEVAGCRRLTLDLGGELVLLLTSLDGDEDGRRREGLCLGGDWSTGLRRGDGNCGRP